MLFFVLTGRVVFPLPALAKLWAHLSEPPPTVSELRPGLAGAFDAVIARALSKEPAQRFESAAALGAAVLAAAAAPVSASRAERALPAPLTGRGAVVGRDAQLATLERLMGRARVVLVSGEPGIGKSSLVARAAVTTRDRTVLYGRCDEQPLEPYQPFAEALRDLASRGVELGLAGRILDAEATDADREALFGAVAAVLEAAGDALLFVIDDLQWADPPTLSLLRALVRDVRSSLVLVATSRESGDALDDLVFAPLRLEGLDLAAATRLIASRAGASPHPDFVRWALERTGGNPFFLEELLRGRADVGSIPADAAQVPESVAQHVVQRLDRLSPGTADLLRIAATVGLEFDVVALDPLTGGFAATLAGVEEAVAAGLIREVPARPGRFEFAHALTRDAIYASMTDGRRVRTHRLIAETLESVAAAPAVLAHQFLQAAPLLGPEPAVRWSVAAAEAAHRVLAFEDEIGHYERALTVLDRCESTDDAARCRILIALGSRPGMFGGDYLDAYERAAALALRHGWSDLLADAAFESGRWAQHGFVEERVVALLELALAEADGLADAKRASLLSALAFTLAIDGRDPARVDALSYEGVALARAVGDRTALARALQQRSVALAGPDRYVERVRLLDEAIGLRSPADPESTFMSCVRGSRMRSVVGDVAGARAALDALAADLVRFPSSYFEAERAAVEGLHAFIDGDLDRAERLAEEAEAGLSRHGDPDAWDVRWAQLVPIRLEQDRAHELIEGANPAELTEPRDAPWRAAIARLQAAAGRRSEAQSELSALTADECAAIERLDEWLPALALLADTCADLQDRATSELLATQLAPYTDLFAQFFNATAGLGPVGRPVARLLALQGEADEAIALLELTLARVEAIPAPVWIAAVELDLALVRLEVGDDARGRDLLRSVSARAQQFGLHRLGRLARQHLVAALR